MKCLNKNLFKSSFSHIYIEKEALNHPNAVKILEYFNRAEIIKINHYKDMFSRGNQVYSLQKKSIKLILAIKKDNLLYKGAEVCESFDNSNFYYTSTMMNCVYDCEYCYLQGMYTSSNVVIFVNIEDIFKEIEELLSKKSIYLCISYDTDILAFEKVIGYGAKWIEFANKHKEKLKIELRTKSANFKSIENVQVSSNMILAWTLSPEIVINEYERKTPALKYRLLSIKEAIDKGWQVRLCFDPMLYISNWKNHYKSLVEATFNEIEKEKILDVSIGVFRVSKDYLKKMRKQRPYSIILNFPFETTNGVSSYSTHIEKDMKEYMCNEIKKYIPEEKIYK
ncbi:SPL family radical SAM protein [Clostridium tarantellae]|uniref:Radical SAM protein n=1 Tax=Clostridium tarantellae TaxID=39493 RepID=A0A6I1MK38_9CLOT|nr:radical SAM protein [Clostridium tarantellae]MPQ43083.1 radical SAM protein [Clostridium tarantellae]